MFETAELGPKVTAKDFAALVPQLRTQLLALQFALKKAAIPVILVISGVDGAGKGEVVHRLLEWFDPRGIDAHTFWRLTEEDGERPYYGRFWRVLPARGRIGIFFGSWYTDPIIQRVCKDIKTHAFETALARITFFERMLAADGALVVKFWFHLSKRDQRRRLKDLEGNPNTHWRVTPADWEHFKLYDKFAKFSARAIQQTEAAEAPWHIIDSADPRYRDLTVGRLLQKTLQQRLAALAAPISSRVQLALKPVAAKRAATILDRVELDQRMPEVEYRQQLEKYQGKLHRLAWAAFEKKRSSVVVLEGWDAAGKGSCIRRLTGAMDARLYRVISTAAPTDEERSHHYLWRFWRHIPRSGMVTLYDRSWYGRVLVERVEGFASQAEWMRAYPEINDFEAQLVEHGIVLSKFWIHLSRDEQLRRFREREQVSYKRYKITTEDWRNRKQWPAYEEAVNDMVARTSTVGAPWTLVPGNDKKFARILILKTLCKYLEEAL